ncbi:KilA-N domain-containing protein [Mucilaginibacter ginsenosidivorax]|uniref:KilA-N domain-containing protein n=1 Tax=Mucilaginibacter ginsenosidivorax TaxID=862126 RepID=A0A5B8W288_9SPHI|nr:KilA-N domain-containing protein [Mucilaginibacter ginsenosidivorax]QEC76986.1 KilA-N domain-containing protein [Mucilaginibacter ginsenosidivorax]
MGKINVEGVEIAIFSQNDIDYISLTDMAKSQHENIIITKWLSLKNTIEYLGEWEAMFNEKFNYTDFGTIKNTAGGNNFVLSVKEWIEKTGAIGITAKPGRYGGTYAHKDIAFQFGMWISPRFQLLLVREFQRLKDEEQKRLGSEWDYRRFLSKANYTIHTAAIKDFVIPKLNLEKDREWLIYASEADLLSVGIFGFTAKQWREANPQLHLKGLNMRDLADAHELLVLSNLEGYNAILIEQGIDKYQRLLALKKAAEQQLKALRKSIYTEEKIKSPFLPVGKPSKKTDK